MNDGVDQRELRPAAVPLRNCIVVNALDIADQLLSPRVVEGKVRKRLQNLVNNITQPERRAGASPPRATSLLPPLWGNTKNLTV